MLKLKKIIHLSDLHLGYEDDDLNCEDTIKKVKEYIVLNCTPRSDYIIVITGDLIDNANISIQWDISSELIQQLSNETLSGDKYDVLLVPGNHDYGTGSNADPKFVTIFKQQYMANSDFQYPHIKIVGDGTKYEKIAFIGLDSNEDELNPSDKRLADGEIGARQLGALEDALRLDRVRSCRYKIVYLHHHPFESPVFKFGHWLKDRRELKNVLKDAAEDGIIVDALLFGHNHGGKAKHNKWNIRRVYDGGSTGGKRNSAFFRIIQDLSDPNTDHDIIVKVT